MMVSLLQVALSRARGWQSKGAAADSRQCERAAAAATVTKLPGAPSE